MSDGQNTPEKPTENSPQPVQVPLNPVPLTSLPPTTGGGSKPWIIMAILVGLISAGIWFLSSFSSSGDEEVSVEEAEKVIAPKPKAKAKPRKAEKTSERPLKSEMAALSAKNRADFEKNVGKWVRLQAEVESGDVEGVLKFKEPAGMTGQLLKGAADHLNGKILKITGWLISKDQIQIDGVFDLTVVDPIDLLPKKDVYTIGDAAQLVALRTTRATFEGKVESVRVSKDEKSLYLIFEGDSHEFIGSGKIDKLKEVGVTEETLEELIGKTIRLKGKLGFKEQDKKDRIEINFNAKDDYEVVE